MDDWVSVEDRMPDPGEEVLVFAVSNDGYRSATIEKAEWGYTMRHLNKFSTYVDWKSPWPYFFKNYTITHWMPLPDPPQEDA